jgi:hypothetical protein
MRVEEIEMQQDTVLLKPHPKQVVLIKPAVVMTAPAHYFEGRGAALKIDSLFEKFVKDHNPHEHHDDEFYCSLYQTDGGTDDSIRTEFGITRTLTPSVLHVVLKYLSTDEGFALLEIPQGEEETNIIIGYADGIVYYVEHEFEDGVREIHLHARVALREWGNDKPLVMVF